LECSLTESDHLEQAKALLEDFLLDALNMSELQEAVDELNGQVWAEKEARRRARDNFKKESK
jgi:hypothetical protein